MTLDAQMSASFSYYFMDGVRLQGFGVDRKHSLWQVRGLPGPYAARCSIRGLFTC